MRQQNVFYEVMRPLAAGSPADEIAGTRVQELHYDARDMSIRGIPEIGGEEADEVLRWKQEFWEWLGE